MITNADCTIYNKYFLLGIEKYQRTQVPDVKWEARKAANVMQSGLIAADSVTVYIPFARDANYVKPKAWQALTTKTSKWTLQDGDFMVKGLVADEIGTGFTITALKAKYDDVVQIRSVDTMDAGSLYMQHWQLGCN